MTISANSRNCRVGSVDIPTLLMPTDADIQRSNTFHGYCTWQSMHPPFTETFARWTPQPSLHQSAVRRPFSRKGKKPLKPLKASSVVRELYRRGGDTPIADSPSDEGIWDGGSSMVSMDSMVSTACETGASPCNHSRGMVSVSLMVSRASEPSSRLCTEPAHPASVCLWRRGHRFERDSWFAPPC